MIEYRVMLTGPGLLAGDYETSEAVWEAEENFTPGDHWGWRVEAVTIDGGITSDAVAFEVASSSGSSTAFSPSWLSRTGF